jgi:hypothetical protein
MLRGLSRQTLSYNLGCKRLFSSTTITMGNTVYFDTSADGKYQLGV